jgi:hypothetical protein
MDDVDRSVWASILLNNMLKKLHDTMWEAIHNSKDVAVTVDGQLVGEFVHRDGRVKVRLDGVQVADVDASPARP